MKKSLRKTAEIISAAAVLTLAPQIVEATPVTESNTNKAGSEFIEKGMRPDSDAIAKSSEYDYIETPKGMKKVRKGGLFGFFKIKDSTKVHAETEIENK